MNYAVTTTNTNKTLYFVILLFKQRLYSKFDMFTSQLEQVMQITLTKQNNCQRQLILAHGID